MIDNLYKAYLVLVLAVFFFLFMKHVRESRMSQSRIGYLYDKQDKSLEEKEELINLIKELGIRERI